MLTRDALSLGSAMLDEAKAYLRLDTDEDDASLGAIILAAIGHTEAFLNQMLITRTVQQTLSVSDRWQRLGVTPVQSVTAVLGLPAEGAAFALLPTSYSIDIDDSGDGWVRVPHPGSAGRIRVTAQAGMAADWSDLPEALRHGVLRLIGHFHAHRDASDDAGPPPAVAALLRPWRRMRLS
jgi:uncharacterized phiE125 gp8 family phage protein